MTHEEFNQLKEGSIIQYSGYDNIPAGEKWVVRQPMKDYPGVWVIKHPPSGLELSLGEDVAISRYTLIQP